MAGGSSMVPRGLVMAVVFALPICASGAQSTTGTGPATKAGIDYTIADGKLTSCKFNGTLGNPDSDEAVCLLLERCVSEGNATRETATTCFRPRMARMIELLNAGLLKELANAPENAPEKTAANVAQPDDIVVEGKRVPRDGVWLMAETGFRMHHADLLVPVEPLTSRSWRRCIKGGNVEPILADLMHDDGDDAPRSSCRWKMKVDADTVKGEQLCAIDGFIQRGKVEGNYTTTQLRLRKDIRMRRLTMTRLETQREQRIRDYGSAEELGAENRAFSRGTQGISRTVNGQPIDRSDDQDFLELSAFRVKDC